MSSEASSSSVVPPSEGLPPGASPRPDYGDLWFTEDGIVQRGTSAIERNPIFGDLTKYLVVPRVSEKPQK